MFNMRCSLCLFVRVYVGRNVSIHFVHLARDTQKGVCTGAVPLNPT